MFSKKKKSFTSNLIFWGTLMLQAWGYFYANNTFWKHFGQLIAQNEHNDCMCACVHTYTHKYD